MNNSFPETVQANPEKYISLGFIKKAEDRIEELESLWRRAITIERQNEQQAIEIIKREVDIAGLRKILSTINSLIPNSLVNLILGSSEFSVGWFSGVQHQTGVQKEPSVIGEFVKGNLIVVHRRDGSLTTADNNCGYYKVRGINSGRTYTASCWVWVPEDFSGSSIFSLLESGQVKKLSLPISAPTLDGKG